ncbi:hypothetical protein ACFCYI_06325 [Streptomyces sp. NPDC056257]|uniref:hypothetical protein n=1 Tax=Streptomyces sp. NPDC056257 TaxID=3345765 RepID=UPI0035D77E95
MSDGPYGPYGPHNPAPRFDQQGQHVYGPQYNADGIQINQADPQAVADAIAWNRQRWQAEQDERERRYYAAKRETARTNVKASVIIIAVSLLIYFATGPVLHMLGR